MERLTQKITNTKKRGLKNYLENLFNGILSIIHRSGPRAPDPYSDPETGSSSLVLICDHPYLYLSGSGIFRGPRSGKKTRIRILKEQNINQNYQKIIPKFSEKKGFLLFKKCNMAYSIINSILRNYSIRRI